MISKRFRINLVIRLILIFILGNAGIYLIIQTPYWMLSVWIFLVLLFGVVELIKYIEKNYRTLGNFLLGIDQGDFSYISNIRLKMKDKGLGKAFNHIADIVENLRIEAETNYQYLQTVVNHIEIGILCFDTDGKVNLVNKAVNRFFDLNNLLNIEKLSQIDKGFYELITSLKPGEKKLYRLELQGEVYQLSVLATHFRKENKDFKLVSFQNIKGELEEKEMESWYRLTRVLTHEIMNSAIPISNLSEMIYETIIEDDNNFHDLKTLDGENKEELRESLRTIQSRSKRLVNFVQSTRRITKLPKPETVETNIDDLLKGVFSLYSQKLKAKGICYKIEPSHDSINYPIDPGQMEQVFINLLQNAIEALKDQPNPSVLVKIEMTPNEKILIRFSDNGKGMNPEEKENLFVPFYTTKKQGSGIGLSLSRHIIHNHNGEIDVKSNPREGTEFAVIL